ncbi:hypothetical protein ACFL3G_06390 [Planctomycetota bacterium]
MGLNDISRGFGHGVGKLVGGTRKVLSLPGSTLSKTIEKLRSIFPNAKVRTVVAEELTRLMGTEELAEDKLERRLKVMAETILALQERLDEMVAGGHISQTDMLEAMDSIKTTDSLTNDERTVLVNVFRQNVALQKPELANTA